MERLRAKSQGETLIKCFSPALEERKSGVLLQKYRNAKAVFFCRNIGTQKRRSSYNKYLEEKEKWINLY